MDGLERIESTSELEGDKIQEFILLAGSDIHGVKRLLALNQTKLVWLKLWSDA